MKKLTFPIAILMTSLWVGTSGIAQSKEDTRDIQSIDQVSLSLTQAIALAEKAGEGYAIEAVFEAEHDRGYMVEILSKGRLIEYTLDTYSGVIEKTKNENGEAFFTFIDPQTIAKSKILIAEAIGMAEQRASGNAIEVEVKRKGDGVRYNVTVATGDHVQKIKIDGTTGQIRLSKNE